MNCPSCGAQATAGDAFCGNCGAQLAPQAQQPTQQMPAAAPQSPQPQQPTQQWQQPATAPPPPPRSSGKTVAIIFAVIALLGLCSCAAVGGWFYWVAQQADDVLDSMETTTTVDPSDTSDTPGSGDTTGDEWGYDSAEEALLIELPSDWVYELVGDTPEYAEYWAGPPASEWMSVYIVERTLDDTWIVTEVFDYDMGLDDQAVEDFSDAEIRRTVKDFLNAIMDDRPNDAQALTIPPFADDPASASYSNGDFYSYYVEAAYDNGDGTYAVVVTEDWAYGSDTWVYTVVPTELGWRINDLAPY